MRQLRKTRSGPSGVDPIHHPLPCCPDSSPTHALPTGSEAAGRAAWLKRLENAAAGARAERQQRGNAKVSGLSSVALLNRSIGLLPQVQARNRDCRRAAQPYSVGRPAETGRHWLEHAATGIADASARHHAPVARGKLCDRDPKRFRACRGDCGRLRPRRRARRLCRWSGRPPTWPRDHSRRPARIARSASWSLPSE